MSRKRTGSNTQATLETGRTRQKLRTRKLLMAAAKQLISEGGRPAVSEVADAAGVSRRTAYRYFPTQNKMLADVALDGLRPVMEAAIEAAPQGLAPDDIEARVTALVSSMQSLALENESLLRVMVHETVLSQSTTKPPRGGRRLEWIERAIKPLRARLGPVAYARLLHALALCTGIEALLVLRDICQLSPKQATDVSHWMAQSLLRESLRKENRKKVPTRRRK